MGNAIASTSCFSGDPYAAAVTSDPALHEDSHGHSFTYLPSSSSSAAGDQLPMAAAEAASFFSLSGAAISANPATPSMSTALSSFHLLNEMTWPPYSACSFESSSSFAAVPLQAAPPRLSTSGPLLSVSGTLSEASVSTTSGPLSDRPFVSGQFDRPSSVSSSFSSSVRLHRSLSKLVAERRAARFRRRNDQSLLRFLAKAASKLRLGAPRSRRPQQPEDPQRIESCSDGGYCSPPNGNVEWAQGMAGEDRFHVAVSEEHGWVFVGIYDGFNGPDATDFLFANLYAAVHRELKGVLWYDNGGAEEARQEPNPGHGNASAELLCNESLEVNRKLKEQMKRPVSGNARGDAVHGDVLKALARALRRTEDAYFEAAERRAAQSPELALMGSCVLVMLMKGADVYVMNVGDSRAVLVQKREPDLNNILGKAAHDLERFKAEIMRELTAHAMDGLSILQGVQLTAEHSTAIEEEVRRIRSEHHDDRHAIVNGRVKGKLKVTRAFGAGYLKQLRWNSTLLEAFKIDYIGTDPYITCTPSLCHHRISPRDRFLVLSSDGLYQYFTNKEVVHQVEMYTAAHPDGDPAQFLVEEVLLRAARRAGMECRELLDIPQGDRRKYHDDVSIIVISFEGRIWRSSV